MVQYFVALVAHIDELKRPENFPRTVQISGIIEAESQQKFNAAVNQMLFENFVRPQGVGVRADSSKPEEMGKPDLTDYMFIPIHMITHVTPIIKPLSGMILLGNGLAGSEDAPQLEGEKAQ